MVHGLEANMRSVLLIQTSQTQYSLSPALCLFFFCFYLNFVGVNMYLYALKSLC